MNTRTAPRVARGLLPVAVAAVTFASGTTSADDFAAVTDERFCSRVQQFIAGTELESDNVIHPDFAAFRESKTQVRPLTTHQYSLPEPGTGLPMRVSCKIKTPDHLNAEYGAGMATDTGRDCRDVNTATIRAVFGDLSATERQRVVLTPDRILLEPDATTFIGATFVRDEPFAWTDADGRLHLRAKRLRVDWENLWLSWAPDRLRGALYCHLVAPEYLRRLVLGESTAPAADDGTSAD